MGQSKIGSGTKVFHEGFNLPFWMESQVNPLKSIAKNQDILKQVLTIGLPSLAVFNGHSYAGGLILGLCHDFRIMTSENNRKVCLSEINLGISMPRAYGAICAATLTKKAFRELAFGIPWTAQEAQKENVVDSLYTGLDDCEKQIKDFAKKFAKVGAMRKGIKRNKQFYYNDAIQLLESGVWKPDEIVYWAGDGYDMILRNAPKKKKPAKPTPKL